MPDRRDDGPAEQVAEDEHHRLRDGLVRSDVREWVATKHLPEPRLFLTESRETRVLWGEGAWPTEPKLPTGMATHSEKGFDAVPDQLKEGRRDGGPRRRPSGGRWWTACALAAPRWIPLG